MLICCLGDYTFSVVCGLANEVPVQYSEKNILVRKQYKKTAELLNHSY